MQYLEIFKIQYNVYKKTSYHKTLFKSLYMVYLSFKNNEKLEFFFDNKFKTNYEAVFVYAKTINKQSFLIYSNIFNI